MDKSDYINMNNKYNLNNIILSLVKFKIFDVEKKKIFIIYQKLDDCKKIFIHLII